MSADAAPEEFRQALAALRDARFRPELAVEEAPAPQRLAPYAVALAGEIVEDDEELASGRLVVLHEPDGVDAWDGTFRVVAFVKARLEPELAGDALLADVAWAWLVEALEGAGAAYVALGGTVTRTTSQSYAAMADRPLEGQVEIRASWTPSDPDLAAHAEAWGEVMGQAAGLPPLPPGVTPLVAPRRPAEA